MTPHFRFTTRLAAALVALVCEAGLSWQAGAEQRRVLTVGPGKRYEKPSAAALDAVSGDTVRIFPGAYDDCAVWRQSNLVIEGVGNGVVIGNRACAGKGVFVILGDNVTIRNVTLTGARVADHNGAGIRAEGGSLTIENGRFIGNEDGILAIMRDGEIVIRNSYFEGNGNCIAQCAHGVYVSSARRLRVENSEFFQQHVGHHIKSRARVTEVMDSFIHDGPKGDASYLIDIPNGGAITIAGNRLEKGPHAKNLSAAIAIGAEQKKPQHNTDRIVVQNDEFANDAGAATAFVRNYTNTPALLSSNRVQGAVTPLEGLGSVRDQRP